MWRKFSLAILILTACCGCFRRVVETGTVEEINITTTESIDIINTYAAELETTNNLYLDRSYVARADGRVILWFSFHTQEEADIRQTRRMMVDVVEGYLKRFNSNPALVALNDGVPFTPGNFYVNIDFTSFYGQFIDILYVARAELDEGEFTSFYAHTDFNIWAVTRPNFHMHTEPYEHTKQFVLVELNVKKAKIKQRIEAIKEEAARRRLSEASLEPRK